MRQSATQPRRLSNHPRLNTAWNALLWISVSSSPSRAS
jgi:hypothetical protein